MLEALLPERLRRSPDALLPIRRHEVELARINEAPRQSVAGRLLSWQTQVPQYPPANFQTFVTKGYRHNPVLRSCIDITSKSFRQARLRVVDSATRKEVPGHDLTQMIRRGGRWKPQPGLTEATLWTQMIQDMGLFGNALWEKVRSATGRVVEIWRLEPQRVAIVPDKRNRAARYLYQVGGQWYPIETRDIVHWLSPDPYQPWFGIPPVLSAHRSLTVDNDLIDHFKVTLQNFAVPAVVLTNEEAITPEQAGEARKAWRKNLGRWRRGDVAVTGGGTKVEVVGLDMRKMAIGDLVATSESRIAMVFGVPMILLGRSGTQADPTRANYAEAKEHFHLDTIGSLHSEVAEQVSIHLLTDWDQDPDAGLEAEFDTSGDPIIQEAKLRRGEKAALLFERGVLSRHRAQRIAGMEVHGPDVFYRRNVDGVIPADAEREIVDELTEL